MFDQFLHDRSIERNILSLQDFFCSNDDDELRYEYDKKMDFNEPCLP